MGLRNAIINDFSEPFLRDDVGALFENFIVSEMIKHSKYAKTEYGFSFWRTTQGAEVNIVAHKDNAIIACEIKISKGKTDDCYSGQLLFWLLSKTVKHLW